MKPTLPFVFSRRFRARIALGACALAALAALSSCAWVQDQIGAKGDSGSGLAPAFWPALPLADKAFIFSKDGRLIDIVYLSLDCVSGRCAPTSRSIALHGRSFLSAPFGTDGPGPLPTTPQKAAAAASSPLAASAAAAAPSENPDASVLNISMDPVAPANAEAFFQIDATREAGSRGWKYSRALSVRRLASEPPEILGVAQPDSLVVMDAFGSLEALDKMKEGQAREKLKAFGIDLPPEPPPQTRKTDESKAKPDPEKGFFRSIFSKPQ